ncbi:unnamed protein product [Phytomonas sp. EM1]|nr:unnamed protein product [Phytomonas sp. EM1]|eukprot:CCW65273.1 unnamed protein product [Phytomonas sp. isolate EM1]
MSRFAQDALDMIRSAEHALSGDRQTDSYTMEKMVSAGKPFIGDKENYRPSVWHVSNAHVSHSDPLNYDLLRQLQLVLGEVSVLRSELAAERDARNESLISLGKRWKEEVMVEVRSGDYAQQRAVSALEHSMCDRLKSEAVKFAIMKRQLEEVLHIVKAQRGAEFDSLEQIREDLESMRGHVDMSIAQCAAMRIEAVQELEKEKATLSSRLDIEMLRCVDMHNEDVKQIQILKEYVREEMRKAGTTIRDLVHQSWSSFAASLERDMSESKTTFMDELKRTGERVRSMEAKIEDSVRTSQAEMRVQSTMLKDRITALESNEAVITSRMDRAEKKADAAHHCTARMDATMLVSREMVEKAMSVSQRAAERAQRVEDVLVDRDARLVQVESQLHLATTAGNLQTAVEACARGLNHLESRVSGLNEVCMRCESLVETSGGKLDATLVRLSQCEKVGNTSKNAIQCMMESLQSMADRLVIVEDTRERLQGAADQQELTCVRLEHRLDASENQMKLLAEKHTQFQKELLAQQHELSARVEESYEIASRSEFTSAAAKAGEERLEKRLIKLESSTLGFLERRDAVQAEVVEIAKEIAAMQSQSAQIKQRIDHNNNRTDSTLEALERLEAGILKRSNKLEKDVMSCLEQMASHTEEAVKYLEADLRGTVRQYSDDMKEHIRNVVSKAEGRYEKITEDFIDFHHQIKDVVQGVSVLGKLLDHNEDRYVSKAEFDSLCRSLASSQAQRRGERLRMTRELRDTKRRIETCERRVKVHYHEVKSLKAELQELVTYRADTEQYNKPLHRMASQYHSPLSPTASSNKPITTCAAVVASPPPVGGVGTPAGGNSAPIGCPAPDTNSSGGLMQDLSLISEQPVELSSNCPSFQPATKASATFSVEEDLPPSSGLVPSAPDNFFPVESVSEQKSTLFVLPTGDSIVHEWSPGEEAIDEADNTLHSTDRPSFMASSARNGVALRSPPAAGSGPDAVGGEPMADDVGRARPETPTSPHPAASPRDWDTGTDDDDESGVSEGTPQEAVFAPADEGGVRINSNAPPPPSPPGDVVRRYASFDDSSSDDNP